jgi:hypothetical protein
MHPIEHLRYVARATGADPVALVTETAQALYGLRHEPAGLVLTARRIVERHPTCAPLWWLCAQTLSALEPFERLAELQREIDRDQTTDFLIDELVSVSTVACVGWSPTALEALVQRGDCTALVIDSFGSADSAVNALERVNVAAETVSIEHAAHAVARCDVVVLDALGCGPDELLMSAGSHAVAALAYVAGKPAYVTARKGTRLPVELWEAMKARSIDARQPWRTDIDVVPRAVVGAIIGPGGVIDASTPVVAECSPTTEMLVRSAM